MPNTAETVAALVHQGDIQPSVVESLLELAEDHQQFAYHDVTDDVTAGEWGRLIETEVVRSVDGGFVVEDPAAVRDGLARASRSSPTRETAAGDRGGGADERSGAEPAHAQSAAPAGTARWQFPTGDGVYSPAVVDDTVLATSNDGTLYAIDGTRGVELWRLTLGGPWISSPAVAGRSVYVGGEAGTLYAIRGTDGTVQWRSKVEGSADGGRLYTPTVADGTAYACGSDNGLYAVDAETGEKRWCFESRRRFEYAPGVSNGLVYAGNRDGNLYAVDAASGTEHWRFEAEEYVHARYTSAPTVVDGTVYFGSSNSNLYAVETNHGTERWHFSTEGGIKAAPAVADGTAYVGSEDGHLYAVRTTDGTERWRFETNGDVRCSPAVVDGRVYVGSEDGSLYAVDADDGTEQWRFETGGRVNWGPAVTDDTAYVGSYDGTLYAVATTPDGPRGDASSTATADEGTTTDEETTEKLFVPSTWNRDDFDDGEPVAQSGDPQDAEATSGSVTDESVTGSVDATATRSVYLPLKMAENLRDARDLDTDPIRTCRDRARELRDFVDGQPGGVAGQSHDEVSDALDALVTSLDVAVSSDGVTDLDPTDDLYQRIDSVAYRTERFFLRWQDSDSTESQR